MRQIDVVPFTDEHVDEAASLLAAQYAGLDGAHPAYTGTLGDPSATRRFRFVVDGAIAAVDEYGLCGYLSPFGARIRLGGHAARGDRRAVYRALYEVFAREQPDDVDRHHITVATVDADGLQTFFELGFGIDQIRGVLSLDRPGHGVADLDLAASDDLDELAALTWELQTFHLGPPMFGELRGDEAWARELVEADLARADGAIFKVVVGDRIVGFAAVGAEVAFPTNARIGMQVVTADARGRGYGTCLALSAIEWAREAGFRWCEVGWTSANPTSDPFWRGLGFEPMCYGLARKVR